MSEKLRKVMDAVQTLEKRFDAVRARRADAAPEWFVAMKARQAERVKAAQTQLNAAEALLPRIAAAKKLVKKHGSSFAGMQNAEDLVRGVRGLYGLAINQVENKQKYDEYCVKAAADLLDAERATKRYEDFAAEVARRQ